MKIRRYHLGEEHTLWLLLYNTVHKVNKRDYSQAQIEAWAPSTFDFPQWKKRLFKTNPFVAEQNGKLVGFSELDQNGHIDCFYCAHNWQGKGVGSSLLKTIEEEASKQSISCLYVEASITAKGFFETKGFSIVGKQVVSLRGEQFTNYAMLKLISS